MPLISLLEFPNLGEGSSVHRINLESISVHFRSWLRPPVSN
jgi:hypothetical protein